MWVTPASTRIPLLMKFTVRWATPISRAASAMGPFPPPSEQRTASRVRRGLSSAKVSRWSSFGRIASAIVTDRSQITRIRSSSRIRPLSCLTSDVPTTDSSAFRADNPPYLDQLSPPEQKIGCDPVLPGHKGYAHARMFGIFEHPDLFRHRPTTSMLDRCHNFDEVFVVSTISRHRHTS